MSRSYKKTAYCGDEGTKWLKKVANRKVRRLLKRNPELELQNKSYKKAYESWDIVDYYSTMSFEEYWKNELRWYAESIMRGYFKEEKPNKEKAYKRWYKYYKMK